MGYKWKPNATQYRKYAERMKEQNSMNFIQSNGAIREGCKLSWIDKNSSVELSGEVITSSYGLDKGQHTFTIQLNQGSIKLVKGRNLYDRLTNHIQGKQSIKEESYLDTHAEIQEQKILHSNIRHNNQKFSI